MQVRRLCCSPAPPEDATGGGESGKTFAVSQITVGHNAAEMYIRLGDAIVVMPPAALKRLCNELKGAVESWEQEHGVIRETADGGRQADSTAKMVIKALYKSRKLGPKLVSVNTRRRKNLPDK